MLKTIEPLQVSPLVKLAKCLTGFDITTDATTFTPEFVSHICAWQRAHGCTPDGIIGEKTWTAIAENAPTVSTSKQAKSNYALAVQMLLNGADDDTGNDVTGEDGIFGKKTKNAVAAYQAAAGLDADGICGRNTWLSMICGTAAPVVNEKPCDMKQYDSRWKSVPYTSTGNKKQTIGNSGCGITCAANVIATWWDSSITPVDTAKEAVDKGYRTANSGTAWGYFKYVAQKYKASKFVQTSSIATAEACTNAGGLVVVSVGPGVWTNGGHYILLWKVKDSEVYINDPASAKAARAKNKRYTLQKQAKQYFCFWR